MTTIAYSSVNIQTTTQSVPSIPSWFGEVTLIAHHLQRQGVFAAIEEQVRFARRRFGRSEVIDFVAVLAGQCDQRGMHTASLLRTTCSPLRPLSWPSLDATAYLRVQPLAACSPRWMVFDVDGTREAARQRTWPKTADRPSPQRRLRPLCAPGSTFRKRGEVVRTRTTVLQAHTHQWLASFGNPGNGRYREELRCAVRVIQTYLKAHDFPEEHALVRLDGQ